MKYDIILHARSTRKGFVMKVSRERLSVIGRMIGIYREERRGNSQNNWTQIKFCDNICSPNTLKNIESGGIARSQELYEKLLEKLDLKLGEFPVIDEAVEKLINELYIAIEYFDNAEIDSLTAKGIKILEKAKEYVYYFELYSMFVDIRLYYLDDVIIDDKKIVKYKSLNPFFGYKLRDILILLMFARIKMSCINNFPEYENFIKEADLINNPFPVIQLSMLHYYYVSMQRFLMMDAIESLEAELISKNNLNRLADTYNFAVVMLSDIDNNRSLIYIQKINDLITNENLSETKIAEISANIATYYYNRKNYSEALLYLNKAVENKCTDLLTNYIIIANCQNHLGNKIRIPKLDKRELKKYPSDLRIMYQYFYNIQDGTIPEFVRIKMILKHIAPILKDKILIDVFRYELGKLIEITNSYKTLYLFEKLIENK